MFPTEISKHYTVDTETGCWKWHLSTNADGYGHANVCGELRRVHRFLYEMKYDGVPDGLELDHLCRNRLCVNPDHLEAVTHLENVRRGDRCKLTARLVYRMRVMYVRGMSVKDICKETSISKAQVSKCLRGNCWSDVPYPDGFSVFINKYGPGKRMLTDEQLDRLIKMKASGESGASIGMEFGVDPAIISKMVRLYCKRKGVTKQELGIRR